MPTRPTSVMGGKAGHGRGLVTLSANDPKRTFTDGSKNALRLFGAQRSRSALKCENSLPVVLHADDDPPILPRLVKEVLRECADLSPIPASSKCLN